MSGVTSRLKAGGGVGVRRRRSRRARARHGFRYGGTSRTSARPEPFWRTIIRESCPASTSAAWRRSAACAAPPALSPVEKWRIRSGRSLTRSPSIHALQASDADGRAGGAWKRHRKRRRSPRRLAGPHARDPLQRLAEGGPGDGRREEALVRLARAAAEASGELRLPQRALDLHGELGRRRAEERVL